jgi:hypothetical protein
MTTGSEVENIDNRGDLPPISEATQQKFLTAALVVLEVGVSAVPGFGGAVATALAAGRGSRSERRMLRELGDLRDELALVSAQAEARGESRSSSDPMPEDEEDRLLAVAELAVAHIRMTSDESKLRRLRRALGSLTAQTVTEEREQFMRLVCRYNELDVFILHVLSTVSMGTPLMIKDAPRIIWALVEEEFRSSYFESQIPAVTNTLEADGLLVRDQEGLVLADPEEEGRLISNMEPKLGLMLTDRGLRFLSYLEEGEARHLPPGSVRDPR